MHVLGVSCTDGFLPKGGEKKRLNSMADCSALPEMSIQRDILPSLSQFCLCMYVTQIMNAPSLRTPVVCSVRGRKAKREIVVVVVV